MQTLMLTSAEGVSATVAARGETVVIAIGAEDLLVLRREGLVHQGLLALRALEAELVPVLVLVGQVLKQQRQQHGLKRVQLYERTAGKPQQKHGLKH